jgi:TP901 family phage tail tape measure protein
MSDINITIRLASKAAEQGLNNFGGAAGRAGKKLKGFELIVKNTRGAFNSFIGNLGAIAVTRAIGGIVNGIGNAVNNMRAFETALVGVGKTTGLSGKDLQSLGKEILTLSTEIPVAATELLGLGQTAAQLGIQGTDNILKFTETMARLAVATDVVGEQGAIAFARIINVTGESVENIDKLGDSLVVLGNNFAATESQILTVANEVAKGGARFGLTAEQVLGMSTAMAALGTEAQVAGSTVQKVFSRVEIAIGKGGKELDKFTKVTGLTNQELINLFETEPDKFFQKLVEGLGDSVKDGTKLSSTLADLGFQDLRVTKTLGPLITRTDLLADAMDKATDSTSKNGALNKESEAVFKTLDSDINKLDNTWTQFTITVVQLVLPAIRSIVQALTQLIAFVNESAAIQGILVGITIGIAALATKILLATGLMVALGKAAAAAWLLMSGPLLPIVLGVAAITAAIITLNKETDRGRLARLKESRERRAAFGRTSDGLTEEIKLLEKRILVEDRAAQALANKKRGQEGFNSVLVAGTESTKKRTEADELLNGVLSERVQILEAGDGVFEKSTAEREKQAKARLEAEIKADAEEQRVRIEADKKSLKRLEDFGELELNLLRAKNEKIALEDGKIDAQEEIKIQKAQDRLALSQQFQKIELQGRLKLEEENKKSSLELEADFLVRGNNIRQLEVDAENKKQKEIRDALLKKLDTIREVNQLEQGEKIARLEQDALADGKITAQEDIKIQEEANRLALKSEQKELAAAQDVLSKEKFLKLETKILTNQINRENALDKKRTAFQEAEDKKRIANRDSTLSTISTLQSSNNKTLATIGKAAAITQIAIDGPQAVTKALAAFPPPFNFVAAALVGTAVAAQAAKVAGLSFQDGGVVPGSSFSGDNVQANVNSGEMILNRQQQAQLFAQANGAGGGDGKVIEVTSIVQIDETEVGRAVSRQVADGLQLGEGGV